MYELPSLLALELHDRGGNLLTYLFRVLFPYLTDLRGHNYEPTEDHFLALKTLRISNFQLTNKMGTKTQLELLETFIESRKLRKQLIHVIFYDCYIAGAEMHKVPEGQTDGEWVLLISRTL